MTEHKFKIGDKVVYEGLIATVESQSEYVDGRPCYGLVADEDSEMTCTADETKCVAYNGEEIDQEQTLSDARFNSAVIQHRVGSITDKYFRDGNH